MKPRRGFAQLTRHVEESSDAVCECSSCFTWVEAYGSCDDHVWRNGTYQGAAAPSSGHPNVKLFITQGGLQSLEEAIYNAVPVVVLPCFGDQTSNAKKIEDRGVGKAVYHVTDGLEETTFRSTILEVLRNDR
ncbi:unnamed protein product [Callosobruchus maculatus]|uniref:Glucuronosyltransferase n=1 Tax=Callosobruchus maculatus TaxID=64391 RepID=A0A653DSH9_CALMS|nr:unnamed protein product [Callosobruchus maculatus]